MVDKSEVTMEQLLESVAREVADDDERNVLSVLNRRVLPLLEAGQAMRDFYDPVPDEEMPDPVIVRFDAAKKEAVKP